MISLQQKHCQPLPPEKVPLNPEVIEKLCSLLYPHWQTSAQHQFIKHIFCFTAYYQIIAFVNIGAWISYQEDHYLELLVG